MSDLEKKLKKAFGDYSIVVRKGGKEISFSDFIFFINGLFAEKEAKMQEGFMKTIMSYLHILGAILKQNGGSYEVKKSILRSLPKTFYVTARENKKSNFITYSLCLEDKTMKHEK